MPYSRGRPAPGFTLIELAVTLIVLGVALAGAGLVVLPLIRGYAVSSAASRELASIRSALWMLRHDDRQATSVSLSGCALTIRTAAGGRIQYQWAGGAFYRNRALLLDHALASACPFSLASSGGRVLVTLAFTYTGADSQARIPVYGTFASFEP